RLTAPNVASTSPTRHSVGPQHTVSSSLHSCSVSWGSHAVNVNWPPVHDNSSGSVQFSHSSLQSQSPWSPLHVGSMPSHVASHTVLIMANTVPSLVPAMWLVTNDSTFRASRSN